MQSPATLTPSSFGPTKLAVVGVLAYAYGWDGSHAGFFATDGTVSGTTFAATMTNATDCASFNGSRYLVSTLRIGSTERPLRWLAADGTWAQLTPEAVTTPGPMIPLGGVMTFTGNSQPWKTDRTVANTVQVGTPLGSTISTPAPVTKAVLLGNGRIVFLAGPSDAVFALDSDGALTPKLCTKSSSPNELVAAGNAAYSNGSDKSSAGTGALWATDGTFAGTGVPASRAHFSVTPIDGRSEPSLFSAVPTAALDGVTTLDASRIGAPGHERRQARRAF